MRSTKLSLKLVSAVSTGLDSSVSRLMIDFTVSNIPLSASEEPTLSSKAL